MLCKRAYISFNLRGLQLLYSMSFWLLVRCFDSLISNKYLFQIIINFKDTKIVQRSLLSNVQFPLFLHLTLVIRNKPILIYYNYSKSPIYSEALIIYLMSFCSRVLSRILHYRLFMSQLLLVVKVSQTILDFDD